MRVQELENSIITLTQELIEIPSQGGLDGSFQMITFLKYWGIKNDISFEELTYEGAPAGLLLIIKGKNSDKAHPTYCLNACLDTATFGDRKNWKSSPTTPIISDGWLYGRGSADSKIAISIFLHVALELTSKRDQLGGDLHILFDAEEHSGKFSGVKSYIERFPNTKGVYIGYPGNQYISIGSRGFCRAKIIFHGISEHSGTSRPQNQNPLNMASEFVHQISQVKVESFLDPKLNKVPKISVTSIHGGDSYSRIPDRTEVMLDIRTTTTFTESRAKNLINLVLANLESKNLNSQDFELHFEESWPAYKLNKGNVLVTMLQKKARKHGFQAELVVSGPSNIGNYLASKDIPAISGFGVTYEGIHASNERVLISSVLPVYQTYLDTVLELLTVTAPKVMG